MVSRRSPLKEPVFERFHTVGEHCGRDTDMDCVNGKGC